MKLSLPGFKSKKSRCVLVLDIGSETVKTLVLRALESKIVILGTSLTYLDRYGVFNGEGFETDAVKKNILETIRNNQSIVDEKPDLVSVGLPAGTFKGRVIWQTFKRTDSNVVFMPKAGPSKKSSAMLRVKNNGKHPLIDEKEEKYIYQLVLNQAKKEISEEFAKTSGILPEDLYFASLKILEIKIDGYRVSALRGYEGERLEFKTLATFLTRYYLEDFKSIFQKINLWNKNPPEWKIVHGGQGVMSFSQTQEKDSIFLDIGGRISQIFIIRDKKLDGISEFEIGGELFSDELSSTLGIPKETAKDLKERYSKKLLSLESSLRIKDFFSSLQKEWFRKLKIKIEQINQQKLLPSNILIFGGGSLLPEFKDILEKGDWEDLPFTSEPEVNFLYPKELKNIEGLAPNLNTPQYVPPLMIYYGGLNKGE